MKFGNIKKGDIVYINLPVQYGWDSIGFFWIPLPVLRVTTKQFFVNNERYWKENGKMIGGKNVRANIAANLGDKFSYLPVVKDQTKERDNLLSRVKVVHGVNHSLSKIKEIKYTNGKLIEISKRIEELFFLIEEGEKDKWELQ